MSSVERFTYTDVDGNIRDETGAVVAWADSDIGLADHNGAVADSPWPDEPPDDPYAEVPPPRRTDEQPAAQPAGSAAVTKSLADLYKPIDWHELWATTSAGPDWLVPDVIERGRLHAIYAPKKHKKSLVTLVMVAELATGRALLGRPNPHERPQRVLYIDIENARDDIRQRLQNAGYGPDDLSNLIYFSFPGLPGLDSSHGAAHLLALVERHEPDLLVLDTTSRVVTGKENDADTFRALYRHALAPVKARGVTVLRLDHAGKDIALGQRGSSAKGDDLDTAWLVSIRDGTRITLRLDFQRTNHHPETVELVQRAAPLRFVRLDSATDRPEVATLLAELERLDVPTDAGRDFCRSVFTANGLKASNGDLAEAIKIRKTCPQDHRTGGLEDDPEGINFGCPQDPVSVNEAADQSCPGQLGTARTVSSGSNSARAVRDLPVSRRGQAIGTTPQDRPTDPIQDQQICASGTAPADDPATAALHLLADELGAKPIDRTEETRWTR